MAFLPTSETPSPDDRARHRLVLAEPPPPPPGPPWKVWLRRSARVLAFLGAGGDDSGRRGRGGRLLRVQRGPSGDSRGSPPGRRRSSPRSTPTTRCWPASSTTSGARSCPTSASPSGWSRRSSPRRTRASSTTRASTRSGTIRAALKTVLKKSTGAGSVQGGSTLTQQTAKALLISAEGFAAGHQAQRLGGPEAQGPRGHPRPPAGEGAPQGGDPLPLPERGVPRAPQLRRPGRGRELLPQGRARPHSRRGGAHRRAPAGPEQVLARS